MEDKKWEKTSPEIEQKLAERMRDIPCDARRMFGFPAYFANGSMFTGSFGSRIYFRFSPDDKAAILEGYPEAGVFEPVPGRKMREYLSFPASILDDSAFPDLIQKSMNYVVSLPEKPKKKGSK